MNVLLGLCRRWPALTLLSGMLAATAGPAQAEGLSLQARVLHPTEVASVQAPVLGQPRRVAAGSEVIYQVHYDYQGSDPATVVITNPFPSDLLVMPEASRQDGARLEVSVDGGRRFGALSKLRFDVGGKQTRAARADDVTHVRWVLDRPLQPGDAGTVSLRARIR